MRKAAVSRTKMTFFITGIIFALLSVIMFFSNMLLFFGIEHGWFRRPPESPMVHFLLQNAMASVLAGAVLTLCVGRLLLRPLHTLMGAIHEVSEGNFQVKVDLHHPKEFLELSKSFNQMTRELAGTELLRADFINNFSHEFKTPIMSILGFARLLKKENLSLEQRQEYLTIMIEEAERLSELSTNVLNLSKVDSLTLLTGQTTFLLSEQLRESILLLENKWEKKEISFDLQIEELSYTGNEALLKQAWVNLLDNAVKFSPAGGTVFLSLKKEEDGVLLEIRDQGIGMDEKTKRCIFEKFYQGDTSHAKEGNGLGLPLVKKIVDLHKGSVTVKSSPGEGSSFFVRLP